MVAVENETGDNKTISTDENEKQVETKTSNLLSLESILFINDFSII